MKSSPKISRGNTFDLGVFADATSRLYCVQQLGYSLLLGFHFKKWTLFPRDFFKTHLEFKFCTVPLTMCILYCFMKYFLSTFFLPVLSAQFITAPTGRPKAIRNLAPAEPPRPENKNKIEVKIYIFEMILMSQHCTKIWVTYCKQLWKNNRLLAFVT